MKNFYILFLLITVSVSAQIEVKIDSIISVDVSSKKRTFSINYHITNTTNKELSFFLIPNTLIANSASSLTLFPVYKIYQNGVFEDVDGPFYERVYKEQEDVENTNDVEQRKKLIAIINQKYTSEYKTIIENYKKNGGTSTDDAWIFKNQKLLQTIVILKPNETKNYTIKTDWNKERYYKIDDNEFYLNENDKFEIELSLNLDKLNRKISLSPEEYSKFEKDKDFLQGTFTSNKMELNFKE
jgi:hypothetical protein